MIAVGFLMESAVEKVAAAFPNTQFAIIDSGPAKPIPNLKSLLFHEQDGGYMAGYLAGLVTKTNVVSTVGGQKIPPVDHYIAGFIAGRQGRQPEGEGAERVLAELHQPGGVQGARAEPDLPALRRRLPGGGRLRPRRALGGEGEGRLGGRRRRRPGLPGLVHPDERDQEGRRRRVRHDQGDHERHVQGRHDRLLHRPERRRRHRRDQLEGAGGRRHQAAGDPEARSSPGRSSRPTPSSNRSAGAGGRARPRRSRRWPSTQHWNCVGSPSASAAWWRTTLSTSSSCRARCTRSWARTAPASRR